MEPSTWGVFHDGVVRRIEGSVPGQVTLTVEIGYLRAMFEGEGTDFIIRLQGCTTLRYSEYDEAPTCDLAQVQSREPEVLYVASEDPLVLDCVMGTLDLKYENMTVSLESGAEVTQDELVQASELYWKRWRESTAGDA